MKSLTGEVQETNLVHAPAPGKASICFAKLRPLVCKSRLSLSSHSENFLSTFILQPPPLAPSTPVIIALCVYIDYMSALSVLRAGSVSDLTDTYPKCLPQSCAHAHAGLSAQPSLSSLLSNWATSLCPKALQPCTNTSNPAAQLPHATSTPPLEQTSFPALKPYFDPHLPV